jgi:hypothetical protein
MSIAETLKSVAQRYARRMAVRVAIGGTVAAAGGLRAYSGADASEAAAPVAAAAPAAAPAVPAVRADTTAVPATVPAVPPVVAALAAVATAAAPDTSVSAPVVASPSDSGTAVAALGRETFVYGGRGRRDPFASLLKAGGDLRPQLADLRLVTVLVGSDGRNSVAIMRDLTTKEQYRRRAGESLGRMRVASIQPRQVVFTIEEFGFSRQEVLMYSDSTTTRTR